MGDAETALIIGLVAPVRVDEGRITGAHQYALDA